MTANHNQPGGIPSLNQGSASPNSTDVQRREAGFLEHMKKEGLLVQVSFPTMPPPTNFLPLVISGEPLSETIIKDRR